MVISYFKKYFESITVKKTHACGKVMYTLKNRKIGYQVCSLPMPTYPCPLRSRSQSTDDEG